LVVGFDFSGLGFGGEAVVGLIPEWGPIRNAEFFVEGDISECVYLYPSCGWIPTEFAVVGMCIPVVVYVFSIVLIVFRVKVEGVWVLSVLSVGAPHVSGGGVFRGVGSYLVFLGGIGAYELSLLGEEGGFVW
jgi:hypothetical protein